MVQLFCLKYCDQGIQKFKTNTGKTVRLEMVSNDSVLCIFLRSKGTYQIKIGYKYNLYENIFCDDKNKQPDYEGKKYRTCEKLVTYNDSIEVSTGPCASFIFDDEKEIFGEAKSHYGIVPTDVDIIEIERIK